MSVSRPGETYTYDLFVQFTIKFATKHKETRLLQIKEKICLFLKDTLKIVFKINYKGKYLQININFTLKKTMYSIKLFYEFEKPPAYGFIFTSNLLKYLNNERGPSPLWARV